MKKNKIPDIILPPIKETEDSLDTLLKNTELLLGEYRCCREHVSFVLKSFKGFNDICYCGFCGKIYRLSNYQVIDPKEYVEYRKNVLSGIYE